jgi:UPF0042 nucleotide-binding protein
MDIVLITGMSGSGKSVALHALEDAGFYCVDNLPPELLLSFIELQERNSAELAQQLETSGALPPGNKVSSKVAIAVDVRSASSLPALPRHLDTLRARGLQVRMVFLDATTDTLVRRYSETRRRHPLSGDAVAYQRRALVQAIRLERELLVELREQSHVIDSSLMRPAQLLDYVQTIVTAPGSRLTLVFESFAFKRGIPVDADYIFDVRMLPNPHYEPELRALTGRDRPVVDFLQRDPEAERMFRDIHGFLEHWLPALAQNRRSYVTVGIGCTGGQHRSVYLVERLAAAFSATQLTLCRHRELDAR